MAKLGELGKIITGNTPKTSDAQNYESNDICFVKPSDFTDNEITEIHQSEFYISAYAKDKARVLPTDSILVTCIGIIGKVAINGFTDHDLIMGVNDAGQIKNQAFAQDSDIIEEIVKPLQNEIIRMNFDNDAIRLIKSSDIICVYGMSIGGTDKKWWQLVMNWLQESTANHLIVLQHRAGTKFTFRWNRLVKEIRSKLFLYGDVPEEKRKALENRIHIDVNHDIFAMDLRKHPLKFEVKIDTSNFSPDVIRNILGPSENTEKPVSNV